MNPRYITLFLLFIISMSTLSAAPRGGYAAPVTVAEVKMRMMAPNIWVNAEVVSRADTALSMEVAGRLLWVVDVGVHVKAGETLAKVDATLLRQEYNEQQAVIQREKARVDFLKQEVERLNALVKQRNISQSNLEQTIADRAVAEGDLLVAQVQAQQLTERLKRSEIIAPFSGVISGRLLQAGAWADSGQAVLHLVDPDELEIQAWLTGQVLPFVKVGDRLIIQGGKIKQSATVSRIVPIAAARSRLYEIRLSFHDKNSSAGQALRLSAPTAQAASYLSLPRDALVLRRNGHFVFRINSENSAERIQVTTGIAMGKFIQIQGDLNIGDQVVVNGGERMRPGQQVKVIDAAGVTK